MSAFATETVLAVRHWTDTLFSFKTTRSQSFRFANGQFTMLGLEDDGGRWFAPTRWPARTTMTRWNSIRSRCLTVR